MRFFLTFQGGENFGKIGQISVRKPQISGKSGRESSDKETPVFCIFRDFRDFRDFGQISGFRPSDRSIPTSVAGWGGVFHVRRGSLHDRIDRCGWLARKWREVSIVRKDVDDSDGERFHIFSRSHLTPLSRFIVPLTIAAACL